ncbi:hypothetical protein QYE76_057224 [Lolium multiflorum]|uniref:Leucine-rich repeat-containing N-terminal plant-type domain-containing protein n=1 Tax=Lolium multiflorum TaxID=4521 RepID=A0AAD8T404_LOLMU|nr:hypothetical protein QYE76_057224 [Lolium multiflorum]
MKHLNSVGLFLLSCTCLQLSAAAPLRAGISREAEALVNWKASLASADESLGSWSLANSTSLCSWTHISCDPAGHITWLDLDDTSLNGTLDRLDFSAFPQLKSLVLSNNSLYGTLPAGIGNLTSLVHLDISDNPYLRGAIPHSIGQLKHLSGLILSDLGLDGTLPEEIGNLTTLEELRLNSVLLTGSIPPTIGMLVKLRMLTMQQNNLTGNIPLQIGNMTELYALYFSDNYLEGQLPGTISNLINLQELDLSINQLGGHIVTELGNSSSLYLVDISNNNFSGLFPSSICMGSMLRTVSARYNAFTGIHRQTFQNCTSLQFVFFTANNIVADIRDIFGEHLVQLQMIAFSQNQLYGTLLADEGEIFFCNYTGLDLIDLSDNVLDGGLSKCFWDIPWLGFMDLSNNSFNGVVPLSRKFPYALEYLRLANNHFEGPFPLALKKCKNLTTLDLGGNNFSGTIPYWISKDLPGLCFFRLSSNMFDGIIPRQILQFRRLQLLDLSKNKLTGAIPDDFVNFTGMAYEQNDDSGYHQFAGKIQIVWKNVDYVYTTKIAGMVGIDLSGNVLSQEIPGGLATLLGLRYLNLSGNHLSGCIPEDIGNLVLLESLDLSRNQLSGEIPPSFTGLKSMSALNLSSNRLYGMIPMGSQLQTLVDPSIYINNLGLCGFPLEDCVHSSPSKQNERSQAEDREALWLYCFVAAGFIFGFWLYWGMLSFYNETGRCAFYQYVDNMQEKFTKKVHSCISWFKAKALNERLQ